MKIKNRPPKLYWLVRLFFPDYDFKTTTAFTFGDTIYCDKKLSEDVLVHERIHLRQMRHSNLYGTVHFLRCWWSKDFFYRTELEAYREQYKYIKHWYKRDISVGLARSLTHPIYGNIRYSQALMDILG